MLSKIQAYVEHGMAAYEESINCRREKLRNMLRNEEDQLAREFMDKEQKQAATIIAEKRTDIENEHETDKKSHDPLVLLQYQHYLETCPETRDKVSQQIARDVKYSNRMQILEKHARKQEERQLDSLLF